MQHSAKQSRTSAFRVAAATIAALAITLSSQLAAPPAAHAAWTRTLTIDFYRDVNFGDGRGRVTSDDGAIDCSYDGGSRSGDCSEQYILPDFLTTYLVKLTLNPGIGSSACVSGQFGCAAEGVTLTVDVAFARASGGDVTQNPSFTRALRKIVGNVEGPGSIRIDAGAACTPPANYEFCALRKYGDLVTISAVPDAGKVFSYMHGVPCPQSAQACEFQLTEDMNVFALFGRVELTFETSGSGELCPPTSGTQCLLGGYSQWVLLGNEYLVEAKPASGWHFDHWNGPCAGQDRTCEFTVEATVTVIATFKRNATPAPTAKPTAKPTPKPTPKPTAAPATPRPSPTEAPGESPAPAESIGLPPDPTFPAQSSPPTGLPGPTGTEPGVSDAPGTAPASQEPAAPGAGSGTPGASFMPLLLLAVLAAIGTVFLGFAVGRRARRAA